VNLLRRAAAFLATANKTRCRSALSAQSLVFGVGERPVSRGDLADGAQHLIEAIQQQLQGQIGAKVEVLWCHSASRRLWHAEDLAPVSPFLSNAGLYLIMGAGFLLADEPPLPALLSLAARSGFAWSGLRSCRDVHAFAFKSAHDGYGPETFWPALACLTGGVGDNNVAAAWQELAHRPSVTASSMCFELSPALTGTKGALAPRPYDSSFYLNTALSEIITQPEDRTPIAGDPAAMARALRAQREVSRVPWIFNSMLNEIEFREGIVEPESIPPEIHLSLTGGCNIECNFCGYAHAIARRDLVEPGQMAKLDFLKYAQMLRLHSGLGEPTTNRHLPAIVTAVAEAHPHLGMNFFTNGIALQRPGLIDALVGRVSWINVSLNAASRETWRAVCGSDHFERICDGLGALLAARRSQRALRPLVYASIVLTTANVHDLPRLPAVCRELGIDRLTGSPYSSLGYRDRFGPEMTLAACRERYDALYPETVAQARQHSITLEIPLPSGQNRASFGTEVRPVHDFARIESNQRTLGRFVAGLRYRRPPGAFCEYLWRLALIGNTMRIHRAQEETHYLYPCIGPLSSLDLSRRTAFRFPDAANFQVLWRNAVFTLLREGQHQPGISPPCDVCRCADTRDPQHFPLLERLVGEFSREHC
jgi:molybdenum cofactor biosynthesis enzyme MoaA